MEFKEILRQFGEKMGEGVAFTPDDAGAVVLDIDGMAVTLLGLEDLGQLVLAGVVGELPPEDRMERLYRAMLEANHNFSGTFGATLAVDGDRGKVTLCKALPLAVTDGDALFAEMEHFVNTLETWKKLVADFRGAELGDGAGRDEPRADGGLDGGFGGGFGGFMQV